MFVFQEASDLLDVQTLAESIRQQREWPPNVLAPPTTWESSFWTSKMRPLFEPEAVDWARTDEPTVEAFRNEIRQSPAFARLGWSGAFGIGAPTWTTPTSVRVDTNIPDPRMPPDHPATLLFNPGLSVMFHQDGRIEIH